MVLNVQPSISVTFKIQKADHSCDDYQEVTAAVITSTTSSTPTAGCSLSLKANTKHARFMIKFENLVFGNKDNCVSTTLSIYFTSIQQGFPPNVRNFQLQIGGGGG